MQKKCAAPHAESLRFITQYDPQWPQRFVALADLLLPHLPPACTIHHVGSTAIPGMPAKDIVDLDIECPIGSMRVVIAVLEAVGYKHEGDLGIHSREAFRPQPGSGPAAMPAHHLYACEADSPELARHLAYRNYLIADPARAAWLAEKKIQADRQADSRDDYIERKAPAYAVIVTEAVRWQIQASSAQSDGCK
jgi:GrpB-like predicted nucleotidyltransferase (UPF0157 family)